MLNINYLVLITPPTPHSSICIPVYSLPSVSHPSWSFIFSSHGGQLVTSRHGCLMVVGVFPTTPAANMRPGGLQGQQREGLSGKAGLPSITMPIETAAQSSALHSQIRPPDRAAQQWDPFYYNGWDQTQYVTDNSDSHPRFSPSVLSVTSY